MREGMQNVNYYGFLKSIEEDRNNLKKYFQPFLFSGHKNGITENKSHMMLEKDWLVYSALA